MKNAIPGKNISHALLSSMPLFLDISSNKISLCLTKDTDYTTNYFFFLAKVCLFDYSIFKKYGKRYLQTQSRRFGSGNLEDYNKLLLIATFPQDTLYLEDSDAVVFRKRHLPQLKVQGNKEVRIRSKSSDQAGNVVCLPYLLIQQEIKWSRFVSHVRSFVKMRVIPPGKGHIPFSNKKTQSGQNTGIPLKRLYKQYNSIRMYMCVVVDVPF